MTEISDWDQATILTTGGEGEIQIITLRDEFFETVSKRLGFVSLAASDNPFIEIKSSDLGNERPAGFTHSDDRVHQMIVCDELLATVFDRRNDANFHEVTFWHRGPSSTCANQIAKLLQSKET